MKAPTKKHSEQDRVAEVTATFAAFGRDNFLEAVIRVCRNLDRPGSFYPVVSKNTLCRVVPAFVGGVADAELGLFKPSIARRKFTSEDRAIAAAIAELGGRRKLRLAKLVHAVEFGPYECPGDGPWYFTADVYKNLAGPASFFPVVRRRENYRLSAGSNHETVVDVFDSSFESTKLTYASRKAVELALEERIVETFVPLRGHGRRSPIILRRTVEVVPSATSRAREAVFVVKVYSEPGRNRFCYSVFRRHLFPLNAGITNKRMSGVVETLEPALSRKHARDASSTAALKAGIAAIGRLPANRARPKAA